MIVLDATNVAVLYSMADAIDLMRAALRAFSGGGVHQPLRHMVTGTNGDLLAVMPAYLGTDNETQYSGFGVKTVVIKPGNPALGLDAHVGLVIVFDPDTGLPRAMMDGAAVTAIRTAAVSAVATDILARPDADTLAILGSGVQARSHLEAIGLVRELRSVRIWSRDQRRAEEFSAWATQQVSADVLTAPTAAAAVRSADLICTTTSSPTPLLDAGDVSAGAHVNAVGSSVPTARELTTELTLGCQIFVDSREAALREAGELVIPIREGIPCGDAIRAEVGEVLLGSHAGRIADSDITLFKSLGLAVEDVLSGFAVDRNARALGIGTNASLFGQDQPHRPDKGTSGPRGC
jgi:ornithine cyclodeaminase